MMVRTLGTVSAGVYFFPPQVFFRQDPRGQQRKRLMAVPTHPVANLILGKAGLAFGPPQALLDPMLRLGDAGKLRQRRFGRGVRQMIIMLDRSVVLPFPRNHERFFGTVATP